MQTEIQLIKGLFPSCSLFNNSGSQYVIGEGLCFSLSEGFVYSVLPILPTCNWLITFQSVRTRFYIQYKNITDLYGLLLYMKKYTKTTLSFQWEEIQPLQKLKWLCAELPQFEVFYKHSDYVRWGIDFTLFETEKFLDEIYGETRIPSLQDVLLVAENAAALLGSVDPTTIQFHDSKFVSGCALRVQDQGHYHAKKDIYKTAYHALWAAKN